MKIPKIFGKRNSSEQDELRALEKMENMVIQQEATLHPKFKTLSDFINKTPSANFISAGDIADVNGWWVKLSIDIDHPLAWNVVQEYAHVLNELSLSERLPTVFKPVSPPPYMNGGPRDFLSWVIECPVSDQPPGTIMKWLESRLPNPVDAASSWEDMEE
ncbi:hypothetical protein F9L33_00190 [Amylibacter sp. SFDW26]|uniref:hypothetical protein n=1 Tax=Amylibacter sp. SFDW26 TaxID=2652722 RepID=UPI0012625840|nr:hypothetical protein [Amylibacter sp. SFDW26]KAB7615225.1 hypothetical protein F9L33_00190 [Amylibacter sp. SFDW26]